MTRTRRRRSTSRALALATLSCLALAGCAGDSTEEGGQTAAEPSATESAPATAASGAATSSGTASVPDGGGDAPELAGGPADVLAAEPAAQIQGDTIRLGLVTVTEGSPFASNGQRTLEGAQYAVDEINEAGGVAGVPIELVVEDTQGSIDAVANIMRKLASEDEVLAVVGPILSGECEVGCPLANQLGLPILAPGVGKPGVVEEAGEFVFKLVADDNVHSLDSLLPVIEQEGFETAVIIKDELDPTSNFMGDVFWPALFDEAGVEVLDVQTFTSGDADFSAQATRIGDEQPDVVALAAGPSDAAGIAIELDRQGIETQLLGSGGLQSAGNDFIAAGGDAIEGTIMAAQFDPTPDDQAQATLIESFEAGSGSDVTLNSAYAYDAVYLLVDQIKQQGVTNDPAQLAEDRAKIKDGLPKVAEWIGVGGPTTLNPDGTVSRPPQIATIVDGVLDIEPVG